MFLAVIREEGNTAAVAHSIKATSVPSEDGPLPYDSGFSFIYVAVALIWLLIFGLIGYIWKSNDNLRKRQARCAAEGIELDVYEPGGFRSIQWESDTSTLGSPSAQHHSGNHSTLPGCQETAVSAPSKPANHQEDIMYTREVEIQVTTEESYESASVPSSQNAVITTTCSGPITPVRISILILV